MEGSHMLNIWSVGSDVLYNGFLTNKPNAEVINVIQTLGPLVSAPDAFVVIAKNFSLSEEEKNLFFCLAWTFVHGTSEMQRIVSEKTQVTAQVIGALNNYVQSRGA